VSCHGNNATPPSPAIAPGGDDLDPRSIAQARAERFGAGGADARLAEIVPGFDAPFWQAGLAGYSDAPMRIIARRHGCPMCVTEALLDRTLLAGGRGFAKADLGELHDNVPGADEDAPLIGQIMGSEPAEMAAAAFKMVEQGERTARDYRQMAYVEGHESRGILDRARTDEAHEADTGFAGIDVNLACPVKKIARKARGGHWLAEPDGAIRILEAVREALPARIPTSIKIRRSFDDTPEMAENFARIVEAAFDIGYAWVTVHGRTVEQKYIGPSRWDLLRDIVRTHNPDGDRLIFGSGDIWNAADVFRMLAYTGVDAVSVARGCIGNPWLFRQCRDLLAGREPAAPSVAEQREVLEQHFGLALAANAWMRQAQKQTGRMMRKFGIRFSAHHPDAEAVRRAMIAVEGPEDWRAVLAEHYGAGVELVTAPTAG